MSVPIQQGEACDDDDGNECTGVCAQGICASAPIEDGNACGGGEGECEGGICDAAIGTFPCSEEGIRRAIAEGGGPHTFTCRRSTTIETDAVIVINKDVILDGEGNLKISGAGEHRLFRLAHGGIQATLSGMTLRDGYVYDVNGGAIANSGTLTIHHCAITGNTAVSSSGSVRGHGGGIYNTGRLTLNDCMMWENRAVPRCNPDCFLCSCGGYGNDIGNEGGTVVLIDANLGDIDSWSGGSHTEIDGPAAQTQSANR